MFEFILGIVIGAAFSPFWMQLYDTVKPKIIAMFNKQPPKS